VGGGGGGGLVFTVFVVLNMDCHINLKFEVKLFCS